MFLISATFGQELWAKDGKDRFFLCREPLSCVEINDFRIAPLRIRLESDSGFCAGAVECKIKSDLLQLFSVVDRELISLRLSSNVTTRRLERSSSGSRCSVCSNGVLLPLSRCSGESVIKKATITVALGSG